MARKRVIVGIDFSPSSATALDQAVSVARLLNAELVLVHATALPVEMPRAIAHRRETQSRWDVTLQRHLARVRHELECLCARVTREGIIATDRVIEDHPDSALLEVSAEPEARLVVVGWPTHEHPHGLRLRSVAERVIRHATLPVLVARPLPEGTSAFSRVLVPTDFSETAERALELSLSLVEPGGSVEVAHFWQSAPAFYPNFETSPLGVYDYRVDDEAVAADVMSVAEKLIASHSTRRAHLTFSHQRARPLEGIRERLQPGRYSLVVMGSHGRRGLRRWILGSVAESTVRLAPCSVVVVHPRGHY